MISCLLRRSVWLLVCLPAAVGCQAEADQSIAEQSVDNQSGGSVAAKARADRDRRAAEIRAEYEQVRQLYQEELRKGNQDADKRFEQRLIGRKNRNEVHLRLLKELKHSVDSMTLEEIQVERSLTVEVFRQREEKIMDQQANEESIRKASLEQRLEDMRKVHQRLKLLYEKPISPSEETQL